MKKYKSLLNEELKTIVLNSNKLFVTRTSNNKLYLSSNKKRLIPNSLSAKLYSDNSSLSSEYGKNILYFKCNKKLKCLVLDIESDDFYLFGKELATPIQRGIEIYKYAIKEKYDVIKLKNVYAIGTEFCFLSLDYLKLAASKINNKIIIYDEEFSGYAL